jgi:hypothetical protein
MTELFTAPTARGNTTGLTIRVATKMPAFRKFPPEIRDMIWTEPCFEPRMIDVWLEKGLWDMVLRSTPAVMHTTDRHPEPHINSYATN